MSDAISISQLGVPAVAVITDPFWGQSSLIAKAKGFGDLPRVRVGYPIAGSGREAIASFAAASVPGIVASLGLA